ncbi:MAG: hypothetical protein JWP81_3987 [Ferruginibacter sp.]|nr:hypothetical protein [Ferruginibacter sp.]
MALIEQAVFMKILHTIAWHLKHITQALPWLNLKKLNIGGAEVLCAVPGVVDHKQIATALNKINHPN